MMAKYNNTWTTSYSQSPFENNKLTMAASEWSDQLSGLTKGEIEAGLNKLTQREEKRFPPNAMEFKELCTGDSYDLVLTAILTRIREGALYKWSDQLAFNFWARYSHEMLNARNNEIIKLIKQNMKMIDLDSMIDLPDYELVAIEEKEPIKSNKVKNKYLTEMYDKC